MLSTAPTSSLTMPPPDDLCWRKLPIGPGPWSVQEGRLVTLTVGTALSSSGSRRRRADRDDRGGRRSHLRHLSMTIAIPFTRTGARGTETAVVLSGFARRKRPRPLVHERPR